MELTDVWQSLGQYFGFIFGADVERFAHFAICIINLKTEP
jgi:hypothetical protein